MSHADKVREAERKVVEAALHTQATGATMPLWAACNELSRLRALTCETCKGEGGNKVVAGYNGWGDEVEEWRPCPAHCASGAKREG